MSDNHCLHETECSMTASGNTLLMIIWRPPELNPCGDLYSLTKVRFCYIEGVLKQHFKKDLCNTSAISPPCQSGRNTHLIIPFSDLFLAPDGSHSSPASKPLPRIQFSSWAVCQGQEIELQLQAWKFPFPDTNETPVYYSNVADKASLWCGSSNKSWKLKVTMRGGGEHIKEAFELAVIPILNLRHKTNISHIGVAITRPMKLQKCGRIHLSSFISHKPQVAICYLNFFVRTMIYVHSVCPQSGNNFPLQYGCERKSGRARRPGSHRPLLTQIRVHTEFCLQDPYSHPWPSGHICIMSVFYMVVSC